MTLQLLKSAVIENNKEAHLIYGDYFQRISQIELNNLDLFKKHTKLGNIPFLKEGANRFWSQSITKRKFDIEDFKNHGVELNRFILIRESASFIKHGKISLSRTALDSIAHSLLGFEEKIVIPEININLAR